MNKKNDESKDPKNETASSFKDTRLSKFLHNLPLGTLLFSPSCGYMRVADSHGSDLLMEVYADNTLQSVFFAMMAVWPNLNTESVVCFLLISIVIGIFSCLRNRNS